MLANHMKTVEHEDSGPILSIVVVIYDMEREAPRTLFTLKPEYQNLPPSLYEVIVVDNGSPRALGERLVRGISEHFQYVYLQPGDPSPVRALNFGASLSRGRLIGFAIDGARMLSPGILQYAMRAARAYDNPVVSTLGYHLGHEAQPIAVSKGYDQLVEDRLLASVDWTRDGYSLFRIAAPAPSSKNGWLAPIGESNCVFVTPKTFDDVGGFHVGFDTPGGGFANLDFYREICEHPETELVILLGEGTFHQIHGDATTGKSQKELAELMSGLGEQYFQIRGKQYEPPVVACDFLGHVPPTLHSGMGDTLDNYARFQCEQPKRAAALESVQRTPNRIPVASSGSRTVIILGMHRSGTSALAGSLQEAGLDLGEVVREAPHNQKGNRENWAILHMQEDLLERNGGSWKEVPENVHWSTLHRAVRDQFVAGFRGVGLWGFKDPRTLFTLDGWLEVLPNAELVGIFRHPLLVAKSLLRRDGISLELGLELWRRYNERLLELHRASPFPLVEFDDDPALVREKFQRVSEALALPGRFRAALFFEDQLRHRLGLDDQISGAVLEIYQELQQREAAWGPSRAATAGPDGPSREKPDSAAIAPRARGGSRLAVSGAQRKDPYMRQLTKEEIESGRHRGFVGGLWERIGRLQFDFLVDRGLRPEHRLLDVGCGPLRGGVHFIRFLDVGGYYGIDKNASLLAAGSELELPRAGLLGRRPNLLLEEKFEFSRFGVTFPYAIAQSVFTHLPLDAVERCLVNMAGVLEPGGRFYATFFEAPTPDHLEVMQRPGGIKTFSDANPFHYHPSVFDFLVRDLPLTVTNLGGWDHPREQNMLEFVREG